MNTSEYAITTDPGRRAVDYTVITGRPTSASEYAVEFYSGFDYAGVELTADEVETIHAALGSWLDARREADEREANGRRVFIRADLFDAFAWTPEGADGTRFRHLNGEDACLPSGAYFCEVDADPDDFHPIPDPEPIYALDPGGLEALGEAEVEAVDPEGFVDGEVRSASEFAGTKTAYRVLDPAALGEFRPAPAPEPFKVGDRVRIIANRSSHCHTIGSVVTITSVLGSSTFQGDGRPGGWFGPGEAREIAPRRPHPNAAPDLF